jgi:hypothetical protein
MSVCATGGGHAPRDRDGLQKRNLTLRFLAVRIERSRSAAVCTALDDGDRTKTQCYVCAGLEFRCL